MPHDLEWTELEHDEVLDRGTFRRRGAAMKFGRRSLHRVGLAALAACFVACSDPGNDPSLEVAAELRALRTMLQTNGGSTARTAPVVDRELITNALSPLREALEGLGAEQKELQIRQLALTQELQRWSQLLAQTVTSQSHSEAEALTARLQQLEAALKAQDTRHREVEALMGGALDRTADRLEDFLKRLEPASPPRTSEPRTEGATPGAGVPQPTAPETASGTKIGAVPRTRRQATTGWWIALLSLATAVGIGFAWRLRRSGAVSSGSPVTGLTAGQSPTDGTPIFDQGVDEIWAAAALLGEAVGRLREAEPATEMRAPEPADSNSAPDSGPVEPDEWPEGDDLFVIDEDEEPYNAPADEEGAVPATPANVARAVPQVILPPKDRPAELACRLRAADPGRAMADLMLLLASDPRVLRRPQPTVSLHADMIEVHCSVLPALPAGERGQLEQRLRDAVA
jgi:hypothetical protein